MTSADKLLPCPFCGGEATTLTDSHVIAVKTSVGCQDDDCRGFIALSWLYDTEAEAIAAWNTRAERTCQNVNINGYALRFECSECGFASIVTNCEERIDELPKFCPNCGAKVVSE